MNVLGERWGVLRLESVGEVRDGSGSCRHLESIMESVK